MFAIEFAPAKIPSWVERVALPKYPNMPLVGYVMLGLGFSILLLGYFTPIKKIRSLLAGLILAGYYPLAYLGHWLLFRYDEQQRSLREASKFEDFLFHHTYVLDWSVLGVCAFFATILLMWMLWATLRNRSRSSAQPATNEDIPVAPAVRVPSRKAPKKPPGPPSDNPFQFG
jgi:hypothetical protein